MVGKFAPLHAGHRLVIKTAAASCDQVVILSWGNPEPARCPPSVREGWLAELYPRAARLVVPAGDPGNEWPRGSGPPRDDGPEVDQRRYAGYLCETVLGLAVDAVFTSEAYGDGFAEELTAWFRRRDPAYPRVVHVPVDPERRAYPVSGTAIRADPHGMRSWLDPAVYASFVDRVCILGGESSGKTTLAAALAARHGTAWVPEYGRELWTERRGNLSYGDLLAIARRQVDAEEAAARCAIRLLFCDSSPLTTRLYSLDLFGRSDPELDELARRTYALSVLCAPDFPFVQDGTRVGPAYRAAQHARHVEALASRGTPYVVAAGNLAERLETVDAALSAAGLIAASTAGAPESGSTRPPC